MAYFHLGYWNICHKLIRKQTSEHSTKSSVIRGKKRAMTVNSHLQNTSIGNSTLPGRQSWHTTTTTSSFLSPFQCIQWEGEALWLQKKAREQVKEGKGKGRKRTIREGSCLATPAECRQKCRGSVVAVSALLHGFWPSSSSTQGSCSLFSLLNIKLLM